MSAIPDAGGAREPQAPSAARARGLEAAPAAPLRIAYAIDGLASGGAQRQAAELAMHLRRAHGVETTVVVYRRDAFHAERLRESGVPVVCVEKARTIDPFFPLRLRRALVDLAPDVVHAFLLNPASWALPAVRSLPRRRRPILVAGERSSLIARTRAQGIRQRMVYMRSDAVTVNAEFVADEIHARLGVARARIHYLPNGIDLAAWRAGAQEPAPYPLEPGCFHVALVGSYRPVKNHRLVLDALERLGPETVRDWRIWFVGDPGAGDDFARALHDEVPRRGLERTVRLVPATPKIAALMARMDAVILPSTHEGFPNVVLEGLALGVPVLAARVGDVANMIDDGVTGFLLETLDAGTLAEGLLRLRRLDVDARSALGGRARDRVEARFSIERVGRGYLDLYRRLVAARAQEAAAR